MKNKLLLTLSAVAFVLVVASCSREKDDSAGVSDEALIRRTRECGCAQHRCTIAKHTCLSFANEPGCCKRMQWFFSHFADSISCQFNFGERVS